MILLNLLLQLYEILSAKKRVFTDVDRKVSELSPIDDNGMPSKDFSTLQPEL
jgi:hypothetical protein